MASKAGAWRVVRVIAQSPRGRTCLAQSAGGEQVVLKELVFVSVPSTIELDAFEREGRLLRELSHARIPRFVDAFREGEGVHTRLYLAQEYVPGKNLEQELAERRWSEDEARSLLLELLEVLEVLAYLHGRSPQIIHRDVKPANIIRRGDGTLTLVDFDAAREVSSAGTHRGTLVGTAGYAPPEQFAGTVDASSDLYALGATVLHLLTRRPPHESWDEALQVRVGPLANVSSSFRAILERLVHARRPERFKSVAEVVAALEAKETQPTKVALPGLWLIGVAAVFALAWLLVPAQQPTSGPSSPVAVTAPLEPVRAPPAVVPPQPVAVVAPVVPEKPAVPAGAFFDFPSAAEPTLRVTYVGARWSDARSPLLPELGMGGQLPSGERWALLDLEVHRTEEGSPVFRPERALQVFDAHGVAVPLVFVPISDPDLRRQFVTIFGLRVGETKRATVGARLRLAEGPFELVFPGGKAVPVE